mgnify:CR=1 FL=1
MSSEEILAAISYDNLLKLGFGVIDVRYSDYEVTDEKYKFVIIRIESNRESFYLDMFRKYIPDFKPDKDINELWSKILAHKISMCEVLHRDISIKVAFYDYWETR